MSDKRDNSNEINMSKKRFYVVFGGTIAVVIPLYAIVSQGIERLF
ncbi:MULTISPECIES: hypothetical protein [Halobacillus]|nr:MULTISPECIES: hypothetical protein [Halobacillus]